jgi:hypothetical protein
VEFVLADLGFCVPLRSLCWLILVFVFLCGPQRNTKSKISQHKLRKGTQKSRSANTNSTKEHKNQDQPTQKPWFLCSFVEFVLADLGFCVPLWSLCWLILVFVFHKLRKGTQKPRSANTNFKKEHKIQDQPTQTPQRNTKTKISQHKLHKAFVEFVLADLDFCVPLRSLC